MLGHMLQLNYGSVCRPDTRLEASARDVGNRPGAGSSRRRMLCRDHDAFEMRGARGEIDRSTRATHLRARVSRTGMVVLLLLARPSLRHDRCCARGLVLCLTVSARRFRFCAAGPMVSDMASGPRKASAFSRAKKVKQPAPDRFLGPKLPKTIAPAMGAPAFFYSRKNSKTFALVAGLGARRMAGGDPAGLARPSLTRESKE